MPGNQSNIHVKATGSLKSTFNNRKIKSFLFVLLHAPKSFEASDIGDLAWRLSFIYVRRTARSLRTRGLFARSGVGVSADTNLANKLELTLADFDDLIS